jgi:YidC/Oxa1 family membrane protein insertase
MRTILILVVAGFCVYCGWLVVESGLFESQPTSRTLCILLQQTADNSNAERKDSAPAKPPAKLSADESIAFEADNAAPSSTELGSVDPQSGFKFKLELSSKGAAIEKATFSGFKDRDRKDPKPLVIMSPVRELSGNEVLAMANTSFVFVEHGLQVALDRVDWKKVPVEPDPNGSQSARFEAVIRVEDSNEQVVRLTKTYKVVPKSYMLECDLQVVNLSQSDQKVRFNLHGPGGLGREAFRSEMRKVIGGFRDSKKGNITSTRLSMKKLRKAEKLEDSRLIKGGADFLWAAVVNKYFAAIVRPVPEEGEDYCKWVADKTGRFNNPDGDSKGNSGDETLGVDLRIRATVLGRASQTDSSSSKTYRFQLYIGPKDNSLFDNNELYHGLGFIQTIDFSACCCPEQLIRPLAFGILTIMKRMHGFWPHNYGVVIIVLVFLVRLLMHPITKRSQVSMSKLQKVLNDPKVQEIRKKYAKKPLEMQRQISEFQKEKGVSAASGFTSMLPMMVQMPIWIALWSAIYAGIELRGAAFLPFWITDLSVPDAIRTFPTITVPILRWTIDSLNLLPILMGVAFYLQQKLMPSQATAPANPQAAQQQKMMMIMMPFLFPIMLYTAPSGVNLYIMSSTFAGVIEQYVIRKHIREKEEAESKGLVATTKKTGGKVKKKKPKPFYRT